MIDRLTLELMALDLCNSDITHEWNKNHWVRAPFHALPPTERQYWRKLALDLLAEEPPEQ